EGFSSVSVFVECLAMVIVPMVFPLAFMFLSSLYLQSRLRWSIGFVFLPVVIFSSVATTLNVLLYPQIANHLNVAEMVDAYPDTTAQTLGQAQFWVCGMSYPVLLAVFAVCVIWHGVHLLNNTGFSMDGLKGFVRKDEQVPILHILGGIIMTYLVVLLVHISLEVFMPRLLSLTIIFTLTESLLLVAMGLAGRRMNQPGGCSLSDLKWNSKPRVALAEQYSAIDDNTEVDEGLLRRFEQIQSLEKLMQRDRIFLNPELSIDSLAAELCTNRLYLSRLINAEFGMNFRAYLNGYRVEFSQTYMMEHPEANQDNVALSSGFQSAQAFNKKFKEVVGLTPKAWCTLKVRDAL
ncbi:MAG: helix-turn-helix transcriptional regulator, partial [Bacteroidaceae bacterium]|nr:helix-turn-helix transcriptional regulator [Bacteroidaceae bacterium]